MDKQITFRKNSASINSVDRPKSTLVELKQTSQKIQHCGNLHETVDQYEVFQNERNNCNTYRLILTINPYCTNVLCNPFTEIVKEEGSNNAKFIAWTDTNYADMIRNTSYSNEGYTYHPGYNIFNNHILRGTDFRVVTGEDNATVAKKTVFNTIEDTMRTNNGSEIKIYKRKQGITTAPTKVIKHLYGTDNLMSFDEAIDANLIEDNGWFGFINTTLLETTTNSGETTKINRVLNNRGACEFIDMYPDRSLFSFSPKYNPYRKRLEYNWDVLITYPYEMDKNNEFVKFGIPFYSCGKTTNPWGREIYQFRSTLKHNLTNGDYVVMYDELRISYTVDQTKNTLVIKSQNDNMYMVSGLGDYGKGDNDYYFHIDEPNFIDYYDNLKQNIKVVIKKENTVIPLEGNENTATAANIEVISNGISKIQGVNINQGEIDLNQIDKSITLPYYIRFLSFIDKDGNNVNLSVPNYFVINETTDEQTVDITIKPISFKKIVGGITCEYYVRKFKKITIEDMSGEKQINNDSTPKPKTELNKEQYKLAFASTIYTDDVTQMTFTDDIDISKMIDHRGRPLSEIYITILKKNTGNTEFYDTKSSNNANSSDVEYSHCFGYVNSGILIHQEETDAQLLGKFPFNQDIRQIKANENSNISSDKNSFDGDIAEFSPSEYKETILGEYNYRFNTWQRDKIKFTDSVNTVLESDEITNDDYDFDDFTVKLIKNEQTNRTEGYYYQPHYRVPLKIFGDINQASHLDINIKTINVVQRNCMCLQITTKTPHRVEVNDTLYLFDYRTIDSRRKIDTNFVCIDVLNKYTFIIAPFRQTEDGHWTMTWNDVKWAQIKDDGTPVIDGDGNIQTTSLYWNDAIGSVMSNNCCFRKKNDVIPEYAVEAGDNIYLWRDVLNYGDSLSNGGVDEYVFTNNAFYINKLINFYLKRQDKTGIYGSYNNGDKGGYPNDVPGKIKKPSNYQYKEEDEYLC